MYNTTPTGKAATLASAVGKQMNRPLPSEKLLQELGFELSLHQGIVSDNGQLFVHKELAPWSDIQMLTFKEAIIAHGCAVSGLSEEHIKYGVITPPSEQKDVLPERGYLIWRLKMNTTKTTLKVGTIIKQKRKELGLTQTALASAMEIALSTLSLLENNKREPQLYLVDKAAKVLKTSVTVLIFRAELLRKREQRNK